MGQEDRKDFEKWKVDLVYELQEGQCANCPAALEQTGFHRDHIDGDHTNRELDNLQLLCPRCHHAKSGEGENPYTVHQKQEQFVLEKINEVIELAAQGKMSGAAVEKAATAMTLSLKVSRNANDVDYGREYMPAAIKLQRKLAEQRMYAEAYMSGFKEGVRSVMISLAPEEPATEEE